MSRDLIVTINPFHESVASDFDFVREHRTDEVLLHPAPSAHMFPLRSGVDIGPQMSKATV